MTGISPSTGMPARLKLLLLRISPPMKMDCPSSAIRVVFTRVLFLDGMLLVHRGGADFRVDLHEVATSCNVRPTKLSWACSNARLSAR